MRIDRLAVRIGLAAGFGLTTNAAAAHENPFGLTGFAGEMMHPLVIPEFLAMFAGCALVAGASRSEHFIRLAVVFGVSLMAGKAAHVAWPWLAQYWALPAVCALALGLVVTAMRPVPLAAGIMVVGLGAFSVGIGIIPDSPGFAGIVRATAAYLLSGMVLFALAGLPLTRVRAFWAGILIRVAGAWLAAVALMYLAFAWRLASGALPS